MSTIKISQLPNLPNINANTSNTLFLGVDIPTGITGKFTATTLAQQLFANNYLVVGQNYSTIFPNTIGQFSSSDAEFIQINLQNFNANGAGDIIVTADTGTNSNSYVDLGLNNSQWNPVIYNQTSQHAYDGYLIVQGPDDDGVGNLVIGTAVSNTNLVVAVGGQFANNITAKFTPYTFNTYLPITFADGTTQNTSVAASASYANAAFIQANSAYNYANTLVNLLSGVNTSQNTSIVSAYGQANSAALYANSAFIQANAVFNLSNTNSGINVTQNTNISSAFIQANAAFIVANNAIANTANIVIPGNTTFGGFVNFNSQYNTNTALVKITASNNFVSVPPANTDYLLQMTGRDGFPTRVIVDSFGTNCYGLLAGRTGRGSASAPTAVQAGDVLLRISGNGYANNFSGLGQAKIDIVASENYTDATKGCEIDFYSTPITTNTMIKVASFAANTASFVSTIAPANGIINTTRTYSGNQTSIGFNFLTDTWVRANIAANLLITPSNFIPGVEVVVVVTNTSTGPGSTHTITHGVSALNSTVGATTFALGGTNTAVLRYFSFDGDLANTYVSITYQ